MGNGPRRAAPQQVVGGAVRTIRLVPDDEWDQRVRRLFGAWVKELRHRRGLTQVVVAERAGITVGYLSQIETGRHSATLGLIVRLSLALDAKPSQLMARLDEVDHPPDC